MKMTTYFNLLMSTQNRRCRIRSTKIDVENIERKQPKMIFTYHIQHKLILHMHPE
jgi:succinyl-CoA synthetase beta subunit